MLDLPREERERELDENNYISNGLSVYKYKNRDYEGHKRLLDILYERKYGESDSDIHRRETDKI